MPPAVVSRDREETGGLLDRLHRGLEDPVAAFAQSVQLSIRGALKRPQLA
ncbi:MAG: hypothetical protein KJO75_10205 [Dactylosporangium sp.]|nr:hypothetical protein [Dactylosporangium sp.]